MKMSYFDDSDTLYIKFKADYIVDTKDLDENTTIDLNSNGDVVAITLEHASHRTDIGQLTLPGIAA